MSRKIDALVQATLWPKCKMYLDNKLMGFAVTRIVVVSVNRH